MTEPTVTVKYDLSSIGHPDVPGVTEWLIQLRISPSDAGFYEGEWFWSLNHWVRIAETGHLNKGHGIFAIPIKREAPLPTTPPDVQLPPGTTWGHYGRVKEGKVVLFDWNHLDTEEDKDVAVRRRRFACHGFDQPDLPKCYRWHVVDAPPVRLKVWGLQTADAYGYQRVVLQGEGRHKGIWGSKFPAGKFSLPNIPAGTCKWVELEVDAVAPPKPENLK